MGSLKVARTIALEDETQVAAARRAVTEACHVLGLSGEAVSRAELAAVELAGNVLRHAGSGRMYLSESCGGALQMIATDSGQGMVDIGLAMQDGFSTGSTPGLGMGAVRRQVQAMEVWSRPRQGTVISVLVGGHEGPPPPDCATLSTPQAGEVLCGDAWEVFVLGGRTVYLVADGLGHGLYASEAAAMALDIAARAFAEDACVSLTELFERMHGPMHATRGAAVSLVSVEAGVATCCGVGNVSTLLGTGHAMRSVVSHNGTVGHQMRRVQEFTQPLPPGSLVIMHSDGLATRWKLEQYAGLEQCRPVTIAGVLYRDAVRGRDDATVLVARAGGDTVGRPADA